MKCKNNPNKSYDGTEPSPKGRGYCASGLKEGTIMKGKNKKEWIVKKVVGFHIKIILIY